MSGARTGSAFDDPEVAPVRVVSRALRWPSLALAVVPPALTFCSNLADLGGEVYLPADPGAESKPGIPPGLSPAETRARMRRPVALDLLAA